MNTASNWEDRYRAADTPWDKGVPSPGLTAFLAEHPISGRVLVPGCGFGHDARALALAGGAALEVLGIDIAPSAVQKAAVLSAESTATQPLRCQFELADLFALPPAYQRAFDWVWEHTCFCAIDPSLRAKYVESVAYALKPGGHYLAVHYMNPEMGAGEYGPPFGTTDPELDALFLERFELLRAWVPTETYPGREGREQMRLYTLKG